MRMTSAQRQKRRQFLSISSMSAVGLLSARALAMQEQIHSQDDEGMSLIVLFMNGGMSQLESFDPHPGSAIGGPTKSIMTRTDELLFADTMPRLAELSDSFTVIRSMLTKEGDHERGRYLMKTGYRPNPSVVHPAIGSICSAMLPINGTEIPRYISLLSADPFSRGGYLGQGFDAASHGDPKDPPQNIVAQVSQDRFKRRLASLDVIEKSRSKRIEDRTQTNVHFTAALKIMESSQVDALRVEKEPMSIRERYGDTPFARGCLAARRLVEVGVRCVEVELAGWDTHANNFSVHAQKTAELDRSLAALLSDLRERGLWKRTIVACVSEFGRTPTINGLDGRDHWPTGFSVILAGGGVAAGRVIGSTDPEGKNPPEFPISAENLFASLLGLLGIDPSVEHLTRAGRPIKLSEGTPVPSLFA